MRALGSAKIPGRGVAGIGGMDIHRRSLLDAPDPHPRSSLVPSVARDLWRGCDGFVKLSWPFPAVGKFGLCDKMAGKFQREEGKAAWAAARRGSIGKPVSSP